MLGSIAGEAQAELSGWLGDYFRTRRLRSIAKTLEKTHRILEDAGLQAHTVPLKTLSALHEGASYEENDDQSMIDRWAALLARAASGTEQILPGYAKTLSELTPKQASVLDVLGRRRQTVIPPKVPLPGLGLEVTDLHRLGLIEWDREYDEPRWALTDYGGHFVRLCRPPAP